MIPRFCFLQVTKQSGILSIVSFVHLCPHFSYLAVGQDCPAYKHGFLLASLFPCMGELGQLNDSAINVPLNYSDLNHASIAVLWYSWAFPLGCALVADTLNLSFRKFLTDVSTSWLNDLCISGKPFIS